MSSLEERRENAQALIKKYNGRIPVVVSVIYNSKLPTIEQKNFLVTTDMTTRQFTMLLRKKLRLSENQSIFMFAETASKTYILVTCCDTLGELYEKYKNIDGFLYIYYGEDSVFGSSV